MHKVFVIDYLVPKIRDGKTIRIGVHNGGFQADEVAALAILMELIELLGGQYEWQRVDRADQETLDSMDVLLDVGREFDPRRGRFDHHQPGGTGYRWNRHEQLDVPFSACGLLWQACGLFLTGEADSPEQEPPGFSKVDWELIRGIDNSDNGGIMPNGFGFKDARGRQHQVPGSAMHFSKIIGQFNADDGYESLQQEENFRTALSVAQPIIATTIKVARKAVREKPLVFKALQAAKNGIAVMPKGVRWQDHIFGAPGRYNVKVVLQPNGSGCGLTVLKWANQSRPRAPQSWRGLEGDALQQASGLEGLVFCHNSGELLVAKDQATALKAAQMLLHDIRHLAA